MIGVCLSWFGKNKTLDENCKSLLDMRFAKFTSFETPGDQPVKYILNDEKIKGKETPIKKLYSHLIDI